MVDLEATPELALDLDTTPNQAVIGPSKHRMLGYSKQSTEKTEDDIFFAGLVRELTGDFMSEIQCDQIQAEDRDYHDELVFFGSKDEVSDAGKFDFLNTVSMIDRFTQDEQPMGFYYVVDPECRTKYGLDESKNFVVILNGEHSIPNIFEDGLNEPPISL